MRAVAAIAVVGLLGAGVWYLVSAKGGGGGGGGRAAHRRLDIGEAASGSLSDTDPVLRSRGPYQLWTLRGNRGQRVVIDMASSAFDSYLMLRTPEGYLIGMDDDGGGGRNARLRTVLPSGGSFTIVAGSLFGPGRGDYTLTASEWIVPEAPAAGSTQNLAAGETKDGMLEPGDELTGDGPYQDRWTIELAAGARVRVTMSSSDMDSYLIMLGPDGAQLTTNDDANGRDAAVRLRAAAAGRYTVLATTFGDQPRVGAYRIAAEEVTGEFGDPGAAVPISLGETRDGELVDGDSTTPAGSLADVFLFRATDSRSVQIDLVATDLDPYLTVTDSVGSTLATDDDGGEGFNSRLAFPVQAGRAYRIVAGTYGGTRRTGAYRISVNPGGF